MQEVLSNVPQVILISLEIAHHLLEMEKLKEFKTGECNGLEFVVV